MNGEVYPEVLHLLEQANVLGLAAEAHDKVCTATCGDADQRKD